MGAGLWRRSSALKEAIDAISVRLIGWGALGVAGVEIYAPAVLAIDIAAAGGLASFGAVLATGSGKSVVDALRRAINND